MVRTRSSEPMGERLARIHAGLDAVLDAHAFDAVAIEEIFKHKSSESALRLGQARGVALLVAAQRGFEAAPYNPMVIKRTVGAHGRADKAAVKRMVGMLLGLRGDDLAGLPNDASDALAIAITHCRFSRLPARAR